MSGLTRVDWIFFGYSLLVGLAAAALYILVPESRTFGVSPYFWLIVTIAIFEAVVMYLRGFEYGPPLQMKSRIAGFFIAVGIFLLLRTSAGVA